MVYIQDRGEIAKYRDYFNTSGCHTIQSQMLGDFAVRIAKTWRQDDASTDVAIFISGNTPQAVFSQLDGFFNASGVLALGTWRHPMRRAVDRSVCGGGQCRLGMHCAVQLVPDNPRRVFRFFSVYASLTKTNTVALVTIELS